MYSHSKGLSESLFERINKKTAGPRIKTFVEFNMEFLAFESRVAHLDNPISLPVIEDPEHNDYNFEAQTITRKVIHIRSILYSMIMRFF